LKLVDRAYIIVRGEVMCEGDSEFLANDPKAARFISALISICSYATRPGFCRTFLHRTSQCSRAETSRGRGGLKRSIREPTVNRPGLAWRLHEIFRQQARAGDRRSRIHVSEIAAEEERAKRYADLFEHRVPCVVFSRNIHPDRQVLRAAESADIPIFQCPLITMKFINLATLALEMMFAPARQREWGAWSTSLASA
jgi:hypothetical protein